MKKNLIRIGILIVTIGCMLSIWPLGVIMKETESKSKAALYYNSGPIKDAVVFKQTFIPKHNYIESISIQMNRDNTFEKGHEGEVLFVLKDENEITLSKSVTDLNQVTNKDYYEFVTKTFVKKGKKHTYTIQVTECESEGPSVRFGDSMDIELEENQLLSYGGADFPEYSTVALYRYRGELGIWDVLQFETILLFIASLFLFQINRENKFEQKKDKNGLNE